MKNLWKKITEWFGKEEVIKVTEEVVEPVVEKPVVKKPEHCGGHTRFKKSCSLCQAIVKA